MALDSIILICLVIRRDGKIPQDTLKGGGGGDEFNTKVAYSSNNLG